tara:strand:- start:8093 stop:9271 length:1179 start_codon:yes stop_codon:yes gene_type:complete
MKIDPYKHKEQYSRWKEKVKEGIPDISIKNSEFVLNYIFDMENGLNIANGTKKGARSYPRLNNLRQRLIFLVKEFEDRFNVVCLKDIKEEQLFKFFNDMRQGIMRRKDGKQYSSVTDYIKVFKAFWHWYQKINRKKGIIIEDITIDLDVSSEKPRWVYLTEEQVKILCNNAKYEYRVLIMFLFDTGIRSPTELINLKVSDLFDFKELNIRDEISKTFGRRIKLMICFDLLKEYIKVKNLELEDYLFKINPHVVNKYLKRLAEKVFGDKESLAGEKYSKITMYDFRHISCCYWLPRYKSESALKYRFGWKKSDKIHYYSEMLGMKDTITKEDIHTEDEKKKMNEEIKVYETENAILKDRMQSMEEQMKNILEKVEGMCKNYSHRVPIKSDTIL